MALREALLGWWFGISIAISLLALVTFGLGTLAFIAWFVVEIVFYFTKDSRTVRDMWVKTAVVNEA
jgi:hypothetical protein